MACRDCGNLASRSYDAKGNPATQTDFNGIVTQFAYGTVRNLETSRTDANGTPRAGTTTTQWHSTFGIPTEIERPGQRTSFTHDSNGNVLTRTITDLVTSTPRTWTLTYDSYGRVLTENGPRTDVADTTAYTYYTCTTGNECGEVHTIENALGQVTTFNSYNAHGQPLTITDPNGVVTTLTYDSRQRLTSRSVAGEATTFEYWPTGLLKKTTLPDGSFIQYGYDAAHRLTRIEDSAGNYARYVLDNAGNRTEENVYDLAGALAAKRRQVYNSLSRLWKQIGAAGTAAVTTTYAYDSSGNQTSINAPLGRNSVNQYDELNRLKQITDPSSGVTQFGYDSLDNLTSVTDPRGEVTSYNYFRDYDAATGRYVQSDPIGLQGGLNTYAYAYNDPVSNWDELGLVPGGGPYHPPKGTKLSCTRDDGCMSLRGKMWVLMRMINSHQMWDWMNPPPRGGGRHAKEIGDLWRAYANCQALYKLKCEGNCPPEGEQVYVPVTPGAPVAPPEPVTAPPARLPPVRLPPIRVPVFIP